MTVSDAPSFDDVSDIDYWRDHPSDSLRDYALAKANPEMLLGFAQLMLPATLIHEGRVFFAEQFTVEGFDAWKQSETYREGGLSAVQAVMNHVHVSDLFPGIADDVSLENWCYVARALAAAWKGSLETAYPERNFIVQLSGDQVWINEPDV